MLVGSKFYAYDAGRHQYYDRQVLVKGGLNEKFSAAIGEIDLPVKILIDKASSDSFFASLKPLAGWKAGSDGKGTHLYRSGNASGISVKNDLYLDGTNRLRSVAFKNPTEAVSWTYTYGAPAPLSAFTVPAGALQVQSFANPAATPKFADSKAKAVVQASLSAYRNLKSVVYSTTNGSEVFSVWWAGERMKQADVNAVWTFNAGKFNYLDTKRKKKGSASFPKVSLSNKLRSLNTRLDPDLRLIMNGRNPLEVLLTPATVVRFSGMLSIGGQTVKVIEINNGAIRTYMQVRDSDHLVNNIITENILRGRVQARTERMYKYQSVNRKLPTSAFSL